MNISLAVCCNFKGRLKHHWMFQTAFHLFARYDISPKYLRVRLLSMRLESDCRRCLLAKRHLRAYGAKCGHFLGRASSPVHGGRCGVGWYHALRRFVRGCMRIAKLLNLAPDHDAVDKFQMFGDFFVGGDATVNQNF